MKLRPVLTGAAVAALLMGGVAQAAQGPVARGRALVRSHCARCHATGAQGASPLAPAPPFRTLHERYPVESLEEALAEGIFSGHPAMPQFRFSARQVSDIVAYLKSLERR